MTETGRLKDQGISARKVALEVLIKTDREGAFTNLALGAAFRRVSLKERDRAFATALVQGVVRNRSALDCKLERLSSKPLSKQPASLRNILRLGAFQLEHMPEIPQSATIDTCCKLAGITGHPGQVKFANGILRNYARTALKNENDQTLDVKYSVPVWLVERWIKSWGREETEALLAHAQKVPPLTLRVCEESITPAGLKDILEGKGMKLRHGQLVPGCLIVEDRGPVKGPVDKIPGFDQGLFTVQDEASAFVASVVGAKPGEVVVDLCAAPGGKTVQIAEAMKNKGRVIAVDLKANRLKLLQSTRKRLGLTNIETQAADGKTFKLTEPADRVLLDCPCTGTGVLNRRTDLRYKRQAPDLSLLVELQRELLANAATLVKPGGVLVYSTCSLETEENEDNITWFLETHKDFSGDDLSDFLPADLKDRWLTDKLLDGNELGQGRLRLMPSRHGLSGFFISRLKREIGKTCRQETGKVFSDR